MKYSFGVSIAIGLFIYYAEAKSLGSIEIEEFADVNFDYKSYLNKYGYLTDDEVADGFSLPSQVFWQAIRNFQKFHGLPITGRLNDETRKMMSMNRCGNKDINPIEYQDYPHGIEEDPLVRPKRHSLMGSKWPRSRMITYKVANYPTSDSLEQAAIDAEINAAFHIWTQVAPIRFEKQQYEADIVIKFVKDDHEGCKYDLRNNTNILAHAWPPGSSSISGDIHFNDYFKWTTNNSEGYQRILPVVLHEIGHTLGVSHSHIKEAVMFPVNNGTTVIHDDDKIAIRTIYGRRINFIKKASNITYEVIQSRPTCRSGNTYIRADNCNQFYNCSTGYPRLSRCMPSLLWNQVTERCDYPMNLEDCIVNKTD